MSDKAKAGEETALLLRRLRGDYDPKKWVWPVVDAMDEAADLIESQAAEIARLREENGKLWPRWNAAEQARQIEYQRGYKAAAAATIERCARVCDEHAERTEELFGASTDGSRTADALAYAIRALVASADQREKHDP